MFLSLLAHFRLNQIEMWTILDACWWFSSKSERISKLNLPREEETIEIKKNVAVT
jgi:hypothetical protein